MISVLEQLEEHSLTGKLDISNAIYLLNNQPTAYDIDKVVEELEERQKEYLAGFGVYNNDEMHGVACGLGDAIEIVKQGGIGKVVE